MKASPLLACLVFGCATLPPPPPVPLPSSTPEQFGRLVVIESMQAPATGASTVKLSYTNDTGRDLVKVRLECTLLDHVDRVVNSDNLEIDKVTEGEAVTKSLRIRDAHSRAERVECRIAGARPTGEITARR
jgi:hypothetical protein